MSAHRMDEAEAALARRWLRAGLEEDHAGEDRTAAIAVPADARGRFQVRNRKPGVPAALEAIEWTLELLGVEARVDRRVEDGTFCAAATVLATVDGPRRGILSAERTFLNFVGLLSGTATLTRRFVEAVGPECTILDTRKTIPGYRLLQKYAVRQGGGHNHRLHLADGILLKDNHRHRALRLEESVATARRRFPGLPLVIEVDDLDQFDRALVLVPDRILLDNFEPSAVREARRRRDASGVSTGIEVSGGVDLSSAPGLAAAGAEYLSVGALTHSAGVWDVGLDEAP